MKNIILIFFSFLLLSSCIEKEFPKQSDVWVPLYADSSIIKEITTLSPKSTVTGGKIYAWGNHYFQIEPNKGIHIFEKSATSAIKKYFLQVYGAQEISIKDAKLYTNNYSDLVTLDISDMSDIKVINRIVNAFPLGTSTLPPERGYFQCVDAGKGAVVGWELQHNISANCQY